VHRSKQNCGVDHVSECASFPLKLSVIAVSLLTRDSSGITEYKVGHAERLKHALQNNLLNLDNKNGR
jgi:hypothetical protein